MTLKSLLNKQVPAGRWLALIALATGIYVGGLNVWNWSHAPAKPPAIILEQDYTLQVTLLREGWISDMPRLEAVDDGAYTAPSPWGAGAATIYLSRVEETIWPSKTTAKMFRAWVLLHELAHVEIEAQRPEGSTSETQPLADLLYLAQESFWAQVFEEAHADYLASVMLWKLHGDHALTLLEDVVAWREKRGLIAFMDPHHQINMVSPWLSSMKQPKTRQQWRAMAPENIKARVFEDTLKAASEWLAHNPEDQADVFHGVPARPLYHSPTHEQRMMGEDLLYREAEVRIDGIPSLPRNPSPSQRVRWLWAMEARPHLWKQVALQSDATWRMKLRVDAEQKWRTSRSLTHDNNK